MGQCSGRHICDHHVGSLHEPAHHFASLGPIHVERERALVAVYLQEECTLATLGDGGHEAILAAPDPIDANHIGAEIGQQRGTERSGYEAAEINNAYPFKDLRHLLRSYSTY